MIKRLVLTLSLAFVLCSCTKDTSTNANKQEAVKARSYTYEEQTIYTYDDLTDSQKKLLTAATQAMGNAYNPYSKFSVGAAILTDDGEIITGTNVENANYADSICAERAAVIRANAMGKRNFKAIAIIGRGHDFDTPEVVAPCGACRQVLYEFSQVGGVDLEVIMSNTRKDKIVISTINRLLPMAFGPKDLEKS